MPSRRVNRSALSAALVVGIGIGGWLGYRYHGPHAPVEIYRGLTYGCDRLPDSDQGGGLVHWVRADLTVPGVRLYVTPMDPDAVRAGAEYRLRRVSTAVADDGLAAAVNAMRFGSDSWWVRLPGDRARSAETAVADGVVDHVDPDSYLMWWDRAGVAHQELTKPPPPLALARAVWAISGQQNVVCGGVVHPYIGPGPTDHLTAIGADPERHLVWVACFDRASVLLAGRRLVQMGATIATLVDGGTSTAMALGSQARGVRGGAVCGNWRPVATQFGFRADPLP